MRERTIKIAETATKEGEVETSTGLLISLNMQRKPAQKIITDLNAVVFFRVNIFSSSLEFFHRIHIAE
jgi:hypothetical protein